MNPKRLPQFLVFFLLLILLIDLPAFFGLRQLVSDFAPPVMHLLPLVFWLLTSVYAALTLLAVLQWPRIKQSSSYRFSFSLFGLFLMLYLPKILFNLIFLLGAFSSAVISIFGLSLSISHYFLLPGFILAALLMFALADAMLFGRFRFKTRTYQVHSDNLPAAFDGFRIVQLSDMHLGSFFGNRRAVQKGLKKVMDATPDLIVFTGDLVNNFADEARPFIADLSKLHAPFGKYAILGNHDYADYSTWDSAGAKAENKRLLYQLHKEAGFRLLLNESVQLEKEGQYLILAGVENWGKPPFHQYGDLNKAFENRNKSTFSVLLSHDPSHWKAQVLPDTTIDLTLSGHTHGMQLGIDLPFFKWSPVKLRYPEWAGLYQAGKQWLNVNRGFGYIGFPGRLGIKPEISVIELHTAKD